jgi:primosomal protein N' (replication factor Y)
MTDMPMQIEVAIPLPVFRTFTYRVPDELTGLVAAGKRVLVPFGSRRLTGYVLGPQGDPVDRDTKAVLDVPDEDPLFPGDMVPFFRWIADYYIHPLGHVIRCALPGGLDNRDYAACSLTAAGREALQRADLPPVEQALLTAAAQRPLRLKDIGRIAPTAAPRAAMASLERRGWVVLERRLSADRIRPLTETFVLPGSSCPHMKSLSPQRRKILEVTAAAGEMSLRELKTAAATTATTIRALARSGDLILEDRLIYRDPFGEPVAPDVPPVLTAEQQDVVERVIGVLGKGFWAYLLAGVTGSGKTEVYMQLAAEVIRQGMSVLILIPEIALISQMERRFRARFGERVALLHSALSPGQRYDQWLRIQRGEAAITIGARSAIFAPFARVGLLVVDEEHDTSYKQEGSLRYNARDLALVRAKLDGGVAVLGSATPSVQSYYNATCNKSIEITLAQRVERRPLPQITLVDLREMRDLRGIRRFISPELHQAMVETLARKEQVLLFLNRRGFATFPVCRDCGEGIRCRNCDISLTLHQKLNAYKCHYCGFSQAASTACSRCGSTRIQNLGLGTEKIETAVTGLFPEARVSRMDRDTTARKGSVLRILKDLRKGRIDVLVGTQMVAKGHDFPNITLVGIICADLSMNFPDFRAGERTFQLLAQVAGRAGRGDAPGRVILQTYNPEHFSIVAARKQDFRAFYDQEIGFRRALKYPPFSRIIQLKIAGRDERQTTAVARALGEQCHRLQKRESGFRKDVEIMGPIEAALTRIAGKYRWQILLKGFGVAPLHGFVQRLLFDHPGLFNRRGVTVAIDVDPFFLM